MKQAALDMRRMQRLDEASEWLLCLQDPARTEAQYNDWLRWCDADPDNLAAFESVQQRWQALDALKSPAAALPAPRTNRKRTTWAVAASVAAIGAATLAIATVSFRNTRVEPATALAQPAVPVAIRAATLPDGSKMILGAQSRVNMDFTGARRELDLSSGEAYFKVRHDKVRPFVVRAGEVSVTAIGTAFDVRRHRDKITITVEEGTVEVSSQTPGAAPATWRAEAGYQLVYSSQRRTASLATVNPSIELAWRNGDLAYMSEPLGSVIEDLNRYSARKIVIADAAVAQIPFTGTAFASSLDGWLAGIEQAYPIAVRRSASGEIVLSSRD